MTVFQVLISLAHSPKYSYKSHKLFWALTNISHILPKYFSHIIQLVLSQIFPILLPNLGPYKYFSYRYQNWVTKLYHLYKSPNSFIFWEKPKRPNKTPYKARCYMALLLNHCYMALLQCPLLYGTLAKPIATRKFFLQNLKILSSPILFAKIL